MKVLQPSSERRGNGDGQRSQRGAVLLFAIVSLLLVSVIGIAVATFAQTVGKATQTHIGVQDAIRQYDGSLEKAVQEYRLDAGAVGEDCDGRWSSNPAWLPSGFSLSCSNTLFADPSAGRIATIELQRGSQVVGLAVVRIEDRSGSAPLTGSTLTVCAWQLVDIDESAAVSC